jgi:membrane protease YdiL (CAAX protease family)
VLVPSLTPATHIYSCRYLGRRVPIPINTVDVGCQNLALLIPPVLVFITLLGLKTFLSLAYSLNRLLLGISFGLAAAFFEEIGWMGFAFPKMCQSRGPLAVSVLLGVLWGASHLPVVDCLGAATPHGAFGLPFFLAFISAMTAMRTLIAFLCVSC